MSDDVGRMGHSEGLSVVPPTPWEQAKQRKSQRQETRIGKLPGGKKQINSGRNWFSKRDNTLLGFLVEARTTAAASYRIMRDEFDRLVRDAIGTPPGMLPGMQIDFEGEIVLSLFVMRLQDHMEREQRIANLESQLEELRDRLSAV